MTDTNFTPGPWEYDSYNSVWSRSRNNYRDQLVMICEIPDHPSGTGDSYDQKDVEERSKWYAESQANALLIAAAPAMYAALKTIADQYDRTCGDSGYTLPDFNYPDFFACPGCTARRVLEGIKA